MQGCQPACAPSRSNLHALTYVPVLRRLILLGVMKLVRVMKELGLMSEYE